MSINILLKCLILLIITILFGCVDDSTSTNKEIVDSGEKIDGLEIIYSKYKNEFSASPLVFKKKDNGGSIDRNYTKSFTVRSNGMANYGVPELVIKKGIGTAYYSIYDSDKIYVVDDDLNLYHSELLNFEGSWDTIIATNSTLDSLNYHIKSKNVIFIYDDITIPGDKTFAVDSNVVIMISENKILRIDGKVTFNGTSDHPISVIPFLQSKPYGGVVCKNESSFKNVIFSGGGGLTSGEFVFGHSGSQAVLHNEFGSIDINNCYFIYNEGKGITSKTGELVIDSTVISFCDMGGEFEKTLVSCSNTWVMFSPDNTSQEVDDDNDGFYFYECYTANGIDTNFSTIENCVFYSGKDDAIDHNGAFLKIKNTWIESFFHEGLAGSNKNQVLMENCIIIECEQGAEAGYGSPNIYLNHCLLINNGAGIAFGDSYESGCTGIMTVSNCVISANTNNIHNFDLKTNSVVDSAIFINNSLIDIVNVNSTNFIGRENVFGQVILNEKKLLDNNSAGKGSAENGMDPGLLSEL